MTALMERKAEDQDALTVAMATAGNILLSPDALAKWRTDRGMATASGTPMDAETLGLMVAQFPGAFTVH